MSPRAACRLETLGFTEVYDYVLGKADWLARRLPIEGERGDAPTAGSVARDDIVTCSLGDRGGSVRDRIDRSPYGFALVSSSDGVVLGRVRSSSLERDQNATAEDLMEPGPSTVRADLEAAKLARRLAERDLHAAIVTTPEGVLLGVARREDLAGEG